MPTPALITLSRLWMEFLMSVIAWTFLLLLLTVTEKIVIAMLGYSVPIYWGPQDVSTIFNSRSFIDCTDIPTNNTVEGHRHLIASCATRVERVAKNAT